MATVTLKGNEIQTKGELPNVGSKAPDFSLTAGDLSTKTLKDFSGSKLVLNIFPSLDTGTCAQSVREFNKVAGTLENTKVLCISYIFINGPLDALLSRSVIVLDENGIVQYTEQVSETVNEPNYKAALAAL